MLREFAGVLTVKLSRSFSPTDSQRTGLLLSVRS